MKQLITVRELAEVLNVPISWIYQRTSMGQKGIPHVKMGKYVRFDADEVMRFLRANGTTRAFK
ncbi:MAG TPA: helix-turn-helix domain-containing protein, partial [Candidatus Omnitrophota bacterium]|nr:helix-turn-helix domain-containing protein [Candidatus Omnitrophota bacterium]